MAVNSKGVLMLKWILALGRTVGVIGFGCAFVLAVFDTGGRGPEVWETLTAADVVRDLCRVAGTVGFLLSGAAGVGLISALSRTARGEPIE